MNGNRGAKGSVKDRLISILYRLRYKKKKLKQDDYTISGKVKQEKYLKTLKRFNESENIDSLEKKDLNELDKINYNVNFKFKKKKGIGEFDLKLYKIESKSSELDEPVNIKKEIKKTKNETIILQEVDKFIKKSLVNIAEIQLEIDSIRKESKEKNKDTKEIEERYKILKEKINKLKVQYDAVKDKYDLSEFSILESIKLMDTIEDYKNVARLNEMEMMLKVCKKEISKIDSISIIIEENKKVGTTIDETKEEHKKIKIKFNKSKQKIKEINSIESSIESEIKYQQEIVNSMYEKASYFEKEITKKIEVIGHRNILGSLFRIAGGILTLPLSGRQLFGVALGHTMINKGLKEMNRELETRERIVVDYKYEDISKQVEQVKDKVEYTNLIISDSLHQIQKIKNNFKNEYSGYDKILPEYNLTINKLKKLENQLLEQQSKLIKVDKKLEKSKEINKQKLKKIEK